MNIVIYLLLLSMVWCMDRASSAVRSGTLSTLKERLDELRIQEGLSDALHTSKGRTEALQILEDRIVALHALEGPSDALRNLKGRTDALRDLESLSHALRALECRPGFSSTMETQSLTHDHYQRDGIADVKQLLFEVLLFSLLLPRIAVHMHYLMRDCLFFLNSPTEDLQKLIRQRMAFVDVIYAPLLMLLNCTSLCWQPSQHITDVQLEGALHTT